jgi:membrane-bound lytic murein transglycosylase D
MTKRVYPYKMFPPRARAKGRNCILAGIAAAVAFGAGCSSSGASRNTAAAPVPAEPAEVSRARQEFSRGREEALSGNFQCAEDYFGRALESVRPARGEAPADPATIAFSVELYEGILRYEAMAPVSEAEGQEGQGEPVLSPEETPVATDEAVLKAREAVDTDSAKSSYDIPIVINDAVLKILAVYQNDLHDVIARGLARSGRFIPMIERIFQEEGLPGDLAQVAMVESSFIPRARSPKAACGIWQFIPGTGRQYGLTANAVMDERNDPEKATRAAAKYLAFLHDLFHDWYLAMAAYNAGEGKILRAMERTGLTDFWQLAASGLLKPQTQNYVPAVIASTLIAKNPSHYGFEVEYEKPLAYDMVRLDRPVHLRHLAAPEGASLEDLQRLNPELRSDITPAGPGGYNLKVPAGSQIAVLTSFAAAPTAKPPTFRRYAARKGDTLASIARRFHATPASLAAANSLRADVRLRRGRVVLIPRPEPVLRVTSHSRKGGEARLSRAVKRAKTAPAPAPTIQAKNYKVRGGDTLYRIALKHGTTVAQILAFNSLAAPSVIKPGDTLKIPAQAR